MDALLTNIKLIPNYEKVKTLIIIDGCNIKLIPNYEKVKSSYMDARLSNVKLLITCR